MCVAHDDTQPCPRLLKACRRHHTCRHSDSSPLPCRTRTERLLEACGLQQAAASAASHRVHGGCPTAARTCLVRTVTHVARILSELHARASWHAYGVMACLRRATGEAPSCCRCPSRSSWPLGRNTRQSVGRMPACRAIALPVVALSPTPCSEPCRATTNVRCDKTRTRA